MLDLISVGEQIAQRRKFLKLTQTELARRAGVSRATLDSLENRRTGELGYWKVSKLLAALGLELSIVPASSRPTLEELMRENEENDRLNRPDSRL